MSLSSARPSMRLLSSRLHQLHRLPRPARQCIRSASRYSNPSSRQASATPSQPASFIDPDADPDAPKVLDRPTNPFDQVRAEREYAQTKSYHMQRMRFATIGLLLSVAGLAATLYNIDLDDLEQSGKKNRLQLDAPPTSNEKFQGREVHIIGAGDGKRIVAEEGKGQGETELVQTGTSSVPYFPRRIYLPSSSSPASSAAPNSAANLGNVNNEEEYTLLGLGIRTVSFLRIQVYVLGLYVRTTDISTLQSRLIHNINSSASTLVPSEKETLKQRLLDPQSSAEIWESLLREEGIKSAWRVVPTRNTDFAHLRDGWITGIKKGTDAAKQKAIANPLVVSEYENESFGSAIKGFKDLFTGGGSAPKGSIILLARDGAGSLEVLFQRQEKTPSLERMGKVDDPRIGRLIWLGYLAGKNVSSEEARKGVVEGCVEFAGRPLGSVETMVT